MKSRIVAFSPEAQQDLLALYDWIAASASPNVAMAYLERIERFCTDLSFASERGHRRDDIRKGLRIIGYKRRITIAFTVNSVQVTILRCFYAGRNWETEL